MAMIAVATASIASANTPVVDAAAPQPAQPRAEVSTANRSVMDNAVTDNKGVQWHDDLNAGWAESRRLGRPMLIFITSDQCRYCDAMKQSTLSDRHVMGRIKDRFVAIRLSPTRNAGVLGRIRVAGYPTTLVGLPEGKVLDHRVGYQPVRELLRLLDRAESNGH